MPPNGNDWDEYRLHVMQTLKVTCNGLAEVKADNAATRETMLREMAKTREAMLTELAKTNSRIARLEVKSGLWGLLGGALVGIPALLTSLSSQLREFFENIPPLTPGGSP
jgi:hypothetical protein